FIVKPPHIQLTVPGFEVVAFPARHFKSARTHGRLELTTAYYEIFLAYEHILVYELDSLVFSDELEPWCDRGYDYVGAPWITTPLNPTYRDPEAVGNGGFSLRRPAACLRVIDRMKRSWPRAAFDIVAAAPNPLRMMDAWWNSAAHRVRMNEDRF